MYKPATEYFIIIMECNYIRMFITFTFEKNIYGKNSAVLTNSFKNYSLVHIVMLVNSVKKKFFLNCFIQNNKL